MEHCDKELDAGEKWNVENQIGDMKTDCLPLKSRTNVNELRDRTLKTFVAGLKATYRRRERVP
jgi:hypothetical protein